MHVCLASPMYAPFPSGIATYYEMLADNLASQGHRVTVLTEGSPPTPPPAGVTVVNPPINARQRSTMLTRWATPNIGFGLASRDWLRANAAKEKIDIIETMEFLGLGSVLVEAGLPAVLVALHGSRGQSLFYDAAAASPREQIDAGLEAISVCLADGVAAHTPANAQEWQTQIGRPIPTMLVPWRPIPAPAATPGARDHIQGIVIGRLQPWKGAEITMQALALLGGESNVRIRWFGGDSDSTPGRGSMAEYLKNKYSALWGSRFEYRGNQPRHEVWQQVAGADFVAVPSVWETFSYAALEAMALGKPLIVASGAGASCLCKDSQDSLVIPSGDAAAFAGAMQRLAGDPALRHRLGQAGREMIERTLTPQEIVRQRIAIYQAAIERRKSRCAYPYQLTGMGPLLDSLAKSAAVVDPPLALLRNLKRWFK